MTSLRLKWQQNLSYDCLTSSCLSKFTRMPQTKPLEECWFRKVFLFLFFSRKLDEAEQKYLSHEKEMTAVVHCLHTWRVYLLGTKFVVVTDNVANTFFKTQKKLSPKQARWQEFLQEYDFVWKHKPGRHNQVAHALSRKKVKEVVGKG